MKRRDFLTSMVAYGTVGSAAASFSGSPDHAPRAKRIIHLIMSGGPSPQDLFDYKPMLQKHHKEELFIREGHKGGFIKTEHRRTGMTASQKSFPIAGTFYDFKQHGQSGAWVSELLPHTARRVDDMCFIKTMHTEHINHDPAVTALQTGSQIAGKPALGAWLNYALGSANRDLPAYFVMTPTWTGRKPGQPIYSRLWGAGFLPSQYSGVPLRSGGDPILYLKDPAGVSRDARKAVVDGVAEMNRLNHERMKDAEILSRNSQYRMAYRMQESVPEMVDLSHEPKHVLDLYGPEVLQPGTFAHSCILARRMAERDVRTVQIVHRGWDQHLKMTVDLPNQCRDVDHALYGLLTDLKQRGLLDDTLVVWGGEFGRTSYCQGKLNNETYGRDHHPGCFTMWLAGGGVKAGFTLGETDDFCYNPIIDPVSIPELHATILHLMGVNHDTLTFKHQGLDQRLVGVEPVGIRREILA